jgi:hypothetical protein
MAAQYDSGYPRGMQRSRRTMKKFWRERDRFREATLANLSSTETVLADGFAWVSYGDGTFLPRAIIVTTERAYRNSGREARPFGPIVAEFVERTAVGFVLRQDIAFPSEAYEFDRDQQDLRVFLESRIRRERPELPWREDRLSRW